MIERVLVAIDGSPLSDRALRYALENFPGAAVTAVTVIDPVDSVSAVEAGGLPVAEDWYEAATDRAEEIHGAAAAIAAEYDAEVEAETLTGRPAREILEFAEAAGVDQIVLGSHGRKGLGRAFLGSVAETVTRRAPIPVVVVA